MIVIPSARRRIASAWTTSGARASPDDMDKFVRSLGSIDISV
jgi:hypothetical protein